MYSAMIYYAAILTGYPGLRPAQKAHSSKRGMTMEWALQQATVEAAMARQVVAESMTRLIEPVKLAVTRSRAHGAQDSAEMAQLAQTMKSDPLKGTLSREGCEVAVAVAGKPRWMPRPLAIRARVPVVELAVAMARLADAERHLAVLDASSAPQYFLESVQRAIEAIDDAGKALVGRGGAADFRPVPIDSSPGTAVGVSLDAEGLVLRIVAREGGKVIHEDSESSPDPTIMAVTAKITAVLTQLLHIGHNLRAVSALAQAGPAVRPTEAPAETA